MLNPKYPYPVRAKTAKMINEDVKDFLTENLNKQNKDIADYMNEYMTQDERNKHGDNIMNMLFKADLALTFLELTLLYKQQQY